MEISPIGVFNPTIKGVFTLSINVDTRLEGYLFRALNILIQQYFQFTKSVGLKSVIFLSISKTFF